MPLMALLYSLIQCLCWQVKKQVKGTGKCTVYITQNLVFVIIEISLNVFQLSQGMLLSSKLYSMVGMQVMTSQYSGFQRPMLTRF